MACGKPSEKDEPASRPTFKMKTPHNRVGEFEIFHLLCKSN